MDLWFTQESNILQKFPWALFAMGRHAAAATHFSQHRRVVTFGTTMMRSMWGDESMEYNREGKADVHNADLGRIWKFNKNTFLKTFLKKYQLKVNVTLFMRKIW